MTDVLQIVDETEPELALADLGIKPELLSDAERRSLDIDGMVVLEDVIPPHQITDLRERIDEFLGAQRPETASDPQIRQRAQRRLEASERLAERFESNGPPEGTTRAQFDQQLTNYRRIADGLRSALATDDIPAMRKLFSERGIGFSDGEFVEDDLFESDPAFDLTLQSPRVLSAVAYVMGPMFHLLNVVARCPRPGEGQQSLHRTEHGARRIVSTIWLLDDITLDNGPTRMVLGSHLQSDPLPEEMEGDPTRSHPGEVKLTGRAGSVVVFDDRNWHGGSLHNGGGPRRVVISSFTQRSLYPHIGLRRPQETLARLSPGQRWLVHPELDPEPAEA